MNLGDNLTEISELAKNGIVQAVEIMKVQMPDLINQIISYYTAFNIIGIIISSIAIVFSVLGIRKGIQLYKKDRYSESAIFFMVFSIVAGIIGIVLIIMNTIELAQLLLAPKLFLIEYIGGLIK